MTLDGKPSFHQWKCLSFIYKKPAGVAALMAGFSFALIPPAFHDYVRKISKCCQCVWRGRKWLPSATRGSPESLVGIGITELCARKA